MKEIKGIVLVFLGACSYGILSTFAKLAYKEGFTVADVTGSQMLFGWVILWGIVIGKSFQSKKTLVKSPVSMRTVGKFRSVLTLMGVGTSTGMVSLLYYQCISLVPASIAILLLMQFTWIGLLLEALVHRKWPSRPKSIAALVIIIGTFFAGGAIDGTAGNLDMEGVIYGLLSAIAYALFVFVSGRSQTQIPPLKKSAFMITGASILVLSVHPPTFLFDGSLQMNFTESLWVWGILLALFGTVIPPLFFSAGMPIVGIGLGSILSAAELPVAVLMSNIILQEKVSSLQWLGVLLILMAMVVPNMYNLRWRKSIS
ncbi:DMT family transporter [Rapidithrix thailandica]|uniref:DMT family transporter n=1 Tax=Rapidithrix thailandica TaxID=413964 RepID=A0AAW9S722_9BACT